MTQFGLAIRNFVGPGEVPDVQALYAYSERAGPSASSRSGRGHVLLGVEPAFPILDSITMLAAVGPPRRIKLGTACWSCLPIPWSRPRPWAAST